MKILFIVYTLSLLNVYCSADNGRLCYKAKTCIHNGKEKCGKNGRSELREFLDTCDLLEYNCLRNNDYVVVNSRSCRNLKAIDEGNGDVSLQADTEVGYADALIYAVDDDVNDNLDKGKVVHKKERKIKSQFDKPELLSLFEPYVVL